MKRLSNSFFAMPQFHTINLKETAANWQLGMSCWETIFHRSMMMGNAFQGRLSLSHPEFTRMWQEKVHAALEGSAAAGCEMQSILLQAFMNPASLPKTIPQALDNTLHHASRLLKAGMAPARHKAKRNAKRLRRKAIADSF